MRFRVGTSGFSYPAWRGSFYPDRLKTADFLPYYAERFRTVEINASFYRMPKPDVLQGWAETVKEGFLFAIKAPRRITHILRLKGTEEPVAALLEALAALGTRRGPLLVQVPPNFKQDLGRLRDFLTVLREQGDPGPTAFEVRHASWLDEPVYELLREHGIAFAAVDTDGEDAGTPLVPTAPFAYVRLRRADYSDAELGAWVERLAASGAGEAYVFFKHEDAGTGPRFAARFMELAAARAGQSR